MSKVAQKITKYVGLDVHAATVVAAVAEQTPSGVGEVRHLGTIPNTPEAIRKLFKRIGKAEEMRACYEAGPTGFGLYWQLEEMGIGCVVVAPTLMPRCAGDRVKTDRKDAEKLARSLRRGELPAVYVPSPEQEAIRDLVRLRASAKSDTVRQRHRMTKFLLRHGHREDRTQTVAACLRWAGTIRFEDSTLELVLREYINELDHCAQRVKRLEQAVDEAIERAPLHMRALVAGLQALRGVAKIGAATLVSEVGTMARFPTAKSLMGFAGIVSSEYSSGSKVRRGAITKTGNRQVRTSVVEAGWSYRNPPRLSPVIRRRQKELPQEVCSIAWKAQERLNKRYRHLLSKGKSKNQAVTAVGRELLGFVWQIGRVIEDGLTRGDERYQQMAEAYRPTERARSLSRRKATENQQACCAMAEQSPGGKRVQRKASVQQPTSCTVAEQSQYIGPTLRKTLEKQLDPKGAEGMKASRAKRGSNVPLSAQLLG